MDIVKEEYQLIINLGALGTVVMEDIYPLNTEEGFIVCMDGFTEDGIRVHVVTDETTYRAYTCVWNNAILLKL